jgi:hypothetical protein
MPRREPDWLTTAEANALAIELGRLRNIFAGQCGRTLPRRCVPHAFARR